MRRLGDEIDHLAEQIGDIIELIIIYELIECS